MRQIVGPHGVLRGIVHKPSGDKARGTAMILHGWFSSDRLGPSRLYVLIARILAQNGYSVWRFDCYGVGESDGEFTEASYPSELDDYHAIMNVALEENSDEFMLVGHSMGTSLAVRLAGMDRRVTKLLLISPSLGPMSWPENLFSEENLIELKTAGKTIRKGLQLHSATVQHYQAEDIFSICASLKVSTTIIYGTADEYYSMNSARRVIDALNAQHFFPIQEADHNFLCGDSREQILRLVDEHIEKW